MANIALKIVTIFGALFGLLVIISSFALWYQGAFSSYSLGIQTLKWLFTLIRFACLILCAIFAWRNSRFTAWFAWGACAAFAIGGATDEVYKRGLAEGMNSLISEYYWVVGFHTIFAIVVWLLSIKSETSASCKA